MQTTHSPEWSLRHRKQHERFNAGKAPAALDPRVTKRFDREFESALKQRGAEAKRVYEERRA